MHALKASDIQFYKAHMSGNTIFSTSIFAEPNATVSHNFLKISTSSTQHDKWIKGYICAKKMVGWGKTFVKTHSFVESSIIGRNQKQIQITIG